MNDDLTEVLAEHILHEGGECYAIAGITKCPDGWTISDAADEEDFGDLREHIAHLAAALRTLLSSDETIERAARAMVARNSDSWADSPWDELTPAGQMEYRLDARAALVAAVGGEGT